jgi:hypothetical protein
LDQAAAGTLATPESLLQIADGMLADPRAQAFYEAFFKQWVGFDKVRAPTQPPADWAPTLLPAMVEETTLFLNDFAWQPTASFLDALTSNYSYVSPELGTYYGVSVAGPGATRVDFPVDHPRENAGLLAHGAVLGAKSDGDLIALRGNWLRSTFLCETLEVPPSLAESLGEQLVGLTRVQIVEKRNTVVACAGCHSKIDPIGVGLSEFDASGRFDPTLDKTQFGIPPALPDADAPGFSTVAELAQQLAQLPQVSACMAGRTFLYTHGREPVGQDSCAIESAAGSFIAEGHSFRSMLRATVEAPAFRTRRAPEPTP